MSGAALEPIYAAGGRVVQAIDAANGAVLWSASIGGRFSHAYGSTLLVAGDLLLVGRRGSVHALDRWTGAIRWEAKVGGNIVSLARAGSESDVQTLLAMTSAQAAAVAAASG